MGLSCCSGYNLRDKCCSEHIRKKLRILKAADGASEANNAYRELVSPE